MSVQAFLDSGVRVAVTGGIATGKSTVVAAISQLGIPVASSDQVASEVFQDFLIQRELGFLLGQEPPVDRATLRLALADRPELRRSVNRLMHPEIGRRVRETGGRVVEVPLLFEACLYGAYDRVWVAACAPEVQRQRLIERYQSESHADAILATQLPLATKLVFADQIIRTDAEIGAVHEKLGRLLGRYSR